MEGCGVHALRPPKIVYVPLASKSLISSVNASMKSCSLSRLSAMLEPSGGPCSG